ncbi:MULTISPECIES: Imm8 family immunity protein [unclassified Psychrobacter]|uniref:Imm8 family immunity protein n=1 Tax=unclassified Psychrobacter TaxID=196806 RepID=UPI001C0F6A69|nr:MULTISPECIES: Imm8 family immunity protein [unclassified Psychrobacter]MBU5615831.1 hypothetical protein [Psychrobacter sp. TAE2020]
MLTLQYISFEDHQDFADFELKGYDGFNLMINLLLGDELGSDIYHFNLVNDYEKSSDKIIIENKNIYFREKGIFVMEVFNKHDLLCFIKDLVKKSTLNKGLDEQLVSLSKYFHWEFDNYVPYVE